MDGETQLIAVSLIAAEPFTDAETSRIARLEGRLERVARELAALGALGGDLESRLDQRDADAARFRAQEAELRAGIGAAATLLAQGASAQGVIRAQIAKLVQERQAPDLFRRARRLLRADRLPVDPVVPVGDAAVIGKRRWRIKAQGAGFCLPAASQSPFVRVVFKARILNPNSLGESRRWQLFYDCGQGFIEDHSASFYVAGGVIEIDAVIAAPGQVFGFRLHPLNRPCDLLIEDFRLYAQSTLRWRLERAARARSIRRRLIRQERRGRAQSYPSKLFPVAPFHAGAAPRALVTGLHFAPAFARKVGKYAAYCLRVARNSGPKAAVEVIARQFAKRFTRPSRRSPAFIAPSASGHGDARRLLEPIRSIAESRALGPFVSILMPVYNTPADVLDAAIQSVLAQTWPNWELCICDDCSTDDRTAGVLDKYRGADWRIKITRSPSNLHIARATNLAATQATGEFVAFLDHDDVLEPAALEAVVARIRSDAEIDVLYTDEDKLEEDGSLSEPYLKPDWSPEHLLSVMYVLHFLVVRKSLFLGLGGLRHAYTGAQDHDLALRATARARKVAHVPEVLYHWRKVSGSAAAVVDAKPQALISGRRAVEDFVREIAPGASVEDGLARGTHRVRWPLDKTRPVTLLILTAPAARTVDGRGAILLVENFIDSILGKSTYRNFHLLVVASNDLPDPLQRKIEDSGGRAVRYSYAGPFNYSAKMNFALGYVETEDVILLNDDLEVIAPDWIEALLEQSRRSEIGAAGARLLFADGRLQHAGVALGVNGSAAHLFQGLPAGEYGRHAFTHVIRNYSAVTGALTATRMSVLREIGLFDPAMRVDFNDIDVCLRIRKAGYRIVYTPFAELYHFEGQSLKRAAQDPKDRGAFLARWGDVLSNDPYYNPGLPTDRLDCRVDVWGQGRGLQRPASVDANGVKRAWTAFRETALSEIADYNMAAWKKDSAGAGTFYKEKATLLASGLFDRAFYSETYADVAASNMDPLDHFLLHGAREGRNPNREFETTYYRGRYAAQMREGDNPLEHYAVEGERRGNCPSPEFDPDAYARREPSVISAGVSPLWHFREFGRPVAGGSASARERAQIPHVHVSRPGPRVWRRPEGAPGVNFIGPVEVVSGLGVSARGFARALQTSGLRLNVMPWDAGFEHQARVAAAFPNDELQPINIVHLNADILYFAMPRLESIVTPERYNIGIWYWELASFRPDWMKWIAQFDEIWCSSEFTARAIASNSAKPVRVMRPALAPAAPPGKRTRADFGLQAGAFVFFYAFDIGSSLDRKNPEALLRAFREEFDPSEGARLLLKTHYGSANYGGARELRQLARDTPGVVVIDKTLSDDDMADLWPLIDCYVSPHRSEGLGLTVIEAMFAGKPVIGTPYGGVADFLHAETGVPLDYGLIEIGATIEPYPSGFVWADPKVNAIRAAMRRVMNGPQAADMLGAKGRSEAIELFSREKTSRAIGAEIDRIWNGAPLVPAPCAAEPARVGSALSTN